MTAPSRSWVVGESRLDVWDDVRSARVTLPDGHELLASPEDTEEYRERARSHGYGADTWALCVEHELGHLLIGWLVTGETSPTLAGVARRETGEGGYWEWWWAEEAAVLGLQRAARFSGSSIVEVVERLSAPHSRASLVRSDNGGDDD